MEVLFIYLLKSAALMAVFLLAYYSFLHRETFFRSNRGFLVAGLLTSVILPLVTFKRIVWVDPQPLVFDRAGTILHSAVSVAEEPFNWSLVLFGIYLAGVAFFSIKLLADLWSLRKVLIGKPAKTDGRFNFIDVPGNVSPFSWFGTIVYNPSLYSVTELRNILEHEKVHSRQWHSADVLLSRIFCIVFWFSPFAWLYKKAMLQNLEFIADSEATKQVSDLKSYQLTLLKITAHDNCISITNHFYQSLIKKRIVMLNKNQSSRKNSWKYVLVVPILAAFMLLFQVNVIAQEKTFSLPDGSSVSATSRKIIERTWTKTSTDDDFKNDAALLKQSGVNLKVSNIKRNAQGEITGLKISYKDDQGNHSVKKVSSKTPIEPINFVRNVDMKGKGEIGFHLKPKNNMRVPPAVPATPEISVNVLKEHHRRNVKSGAVMPTVIVDGEVVASDFDMETIGSDEIETMYVYSAQSGDGTGDGVIRIDTKKITAEARAKAEEAMTEARRHQQEPRHQKGREQAELARKNREVLYAQREAARAKLRSERNNPEVIGEERMTKEELKEAKRALDFARVDIEKAKIDMEQARQELEKAKQELEQSRKEIKLKK